MAINNWRYVVTWGYMDPDWNIIEERQWVNWETYSPDHILWQINSLLSWEKTPEQVRYEDKIWSYIYPDNSTRYDSWISQSVNGNSGERFSPAETYKLSADWYYNQWNNALWDAYSALWNWSNVYANTARQMNDFYSAYADDIAKREMGLAWVKSDLADRLYSDMSQTRQYVLDNFWPNWTLTQEINKYYDDLGNYLATDAWYEAAKIAAQWVHSWASLWAIRAQQNEAYNQSFERYVKAKEQEINAKQQIATNLINFMSTLRQEYWDTTNTYIISQYQRANDLLNNISASIAKSNIELLWTKLNQSLTWSKSSSSSSSSADLNVWNSFIKDVLNTDDKVNAFNKMSSADQTALYNNYKKAYYEAVFSNWGTNTEENTDNGVWWNFVITK